MRVHQFPVPYLYVTVPAEYHSISLRFLDIAPYLILTSLARAQASALARAQAQPRHQMPSALPQCHSIWYRRGWFPPPPRPEGYGSPTHPVGGAWGLEPLNFMFDAFQTPLHENPLDLMKFVEFQN